MSEKPMSLVATGRALYAKWGELMGRHGVNADWDHLTTVEQVTWVGVAIVSRQLAREHCDRHADIPGCQMIADKKEIKP